MTTPGGELLGEARIEIEADPDPAMRALQQFSRDAQGRIRDVRGRFVAESLEINRALAGIRLDLDTDPATRAVTEFTRDANGRLRDLRGRFVQETGRIRDSLTNSGREGGNSFLDGLTNVLRRVPDAIGGALSAAQAAAQRLGQNPYVQAAGVAIAAGIATVAVPLIGALISAATISVAGLGVIGLGAVILKDEPAVVSAAESLIETVKGIFERAAEPLVAPFTNALVDLQTTAKLLAPEIRQAFGLAVPFIEPLVEGIDEFANGVMPGLLALLRGGQPVFDALGESLGILGKSIGDALTVIGAQGPEAGQALKDVATVVGGLIVGFGLLVASLADIYGKIRKFISDVVGVFQSLYDRLVGNSIIPDLVNDIVAWFARLPGRAVQALASLGGRIAEVARSAFQRFRDAAAQRISQLIELVRGVPGRVRNALGNLGELLRSAGRDLIRGMINGVRSMAGALASAARDAVSGAVDSAKDFLGIRSPSTVFAGIGHDTAQGMIVGLSDRIPALEAATKNLTQAVVRSGASAVPDVSSMLSTGQSGAGTSTAATNVNVAAAAAPNITVMIGNRAIKEYVEVVVNQVNDTAARQQLQGVRR